MEITNDILAAYAEGGLPENGKAAVRQYLAEHPERMGDVLIMMDDDADLSVGDGTGMEERLMEDVDAALDNLLAEIDAETEDERPFPLLAMAAENRVDNLCAIRCEGIALRRYGFKVTDEELIRESEAAGLLKERGMALHDMGRLSGSRGLSVVRKYRSTVDDLRESLEGGAVVMAAVDGGELSGDPVTELLEDRLVGEIPDHAVIVSSVKDDSVSVIDSATPEKVDSYPLRQFMDAWRDSLNYMVAISDSEYVPRPMDLSDVVLPEELMELREAIAENAHEVWARTRKDEGWSYGPERDDRKKLHPDMMSYDRLPDSEKVYDREMAMNTIRLLIKLGYDIKKRN